MALSEIGRSTNLLNVRMDLDCTGTEVPNQKIRSDVLAILFASENRDNFLLWLALYEMECIPARCKTSPARDARCDDMHFPIETGQ